MNSKAAPAALGSDVRVPDSWRVDPLEEFVDRITYGFTNPMPTTGDGPYMVTAKDINGGRIVYETARRTSSEAYLNDLTDKSRPAVGDVLLTKDGSIGRVAVCDREGICINQSVATMRPSGGSDSRFLSYLLQAPQYQRQMANDADGSTIKHIYITRVGKMYIAMPPHAEQIAIAEVLGALDDKIAANRRLVDQLRVLAQAKFRSVLSENPVNVTLGAVAKFHNRRRAPLSALEREGRVGEVPYYGATGVFDYVDEALFDEILVLVGEDGSVVTGDGYPVAQYIWGPAWVNNHAHVLTGSSISTEILLLAIECVNVESLVTGAVQPKLNMGNLRKLELLVPGPDECPTLDNQVQPMFEMLRSLHEESRTLETIRETLLPRLMSGELRVRDAEEVVSNAV